MTKNELSPELQEIILKTVLENAIKYKGIASMNSVMSVLMSQYPDLRQQAKALVPYIQSIIKKVNKLNNEQQKTKFSKFKQVPEIEKPKVAAKDQATLPSLSNVSKKKTVVMRLAPYPSGPLHIGNTRMVILNDEYVKRYKGKLILAYDDTIGGGGKEILPEAYDLIRENLDWLEVSIHQTIYKSDRIPIYYEYAQKLIEKGAAYVCECAGDVFREKYKNQGVSCPHRSRTISENLDLWDKMLSNVFSPGEAVIRLKTNMNDPNPALRDNILLRISDRTHPRIGDKYSVWPLLEFNWAIDDHLLDITHILRGKDLVKEDLIETKIWKIFDWPIREFIHYGRMRFRDLKLSKSFAAKNIREGIYQGWTDPRTWSLDSLRYRGIQPQAIRKAMLDLGLTLVDIDYRPDVLYSFNRKIIDSTSPRYFAILDPVKLRVSKLPGDLTAKVPIHPDFETRGERIIKLPASQKSGKVLIDKRDGKNLQVNQIIRLKDLLNCKIKQLGKTIEADYIDQSIETIREIRGRIIHWLPEKDNLPLTLQMPAGEIISGKAESTLVNLTPSDKGTLVQFERVGFVNIFQTNPLVKAAFTHK